MHTCYHNVLIQLHSVHPYIGGIITIQRFLLIVVVFLIESHAGSGLRITTVSYNTSALPAHSLQEHEVQVQNLSGHQELMSYHALLVGMQWGKISLCNFWLQEHRLTV